MSAVERIKNTKYLKYLAHGSLTAARPILGARGMVAAWRGDWASAERNFTIGFATDLEGIPARLFEATSNLGSKADPVADFVIRAQTLAAFLPTMNKGAWSAIVAGEAANLRMNARIQKNREHSYIPQEAKDGAGIQAAGAVLYMRSMRHNSPDLKLTAEGTMVMGTAKRVRKYVSLYRHPELIPPERAKLR